MVVANFFHIRKWNKMRYETKKKKISRINWIMESVEHADEITLVICLHIQCYVYFDWNKRRKKKKHKKIELAIISWNWRQMPNILLLSIFDSTIVSWWKKNSQPLSLFRFFSLQLMKSKKKVEFQKPLWRLHFGEKWQKSVFSLSSPCVASGTTFGSMFFFFCGRMQTVKRKQYPYLIKQQFNEPLFFRFVWRKFYLFSFVENVITFPISSCRTRDLQKKTEETIQLR